MRLTRVFSGTDASAPAGIWEQEVVIVEEYTLEEWVNELNSKTHRARKEYDELIAAVRRSIEEIDAVLACERCRPWHGNGLRNIRAELGRVVPTAKSKGG